MKASPVVSGNSNRPVFMGAPGSSSEAIRLTARDILRSSSLAGANSGSLLQNSDLLLQVVDHRLIRLLLLVHPACQRHQHQPEYVNLRFLQPPIEEMQREILFYN